MLATQTNQSLSANWSEQNFVDKLILALKAAGFPSSPYDYHPAADTGTNRYIVYQFAGDTTKAHGYIYLRIRWTVNAITGAITLYSALFDTWSTTNRTGTSQGTEITCNLVPVPTSAVDFYSFSHLEIKHLAFNQGSSWGYLNFLKPANKIIIGSTTLFDEATYPYGFIGGATDLSLLYGVVSALSPTGDTIYYMERPGELAIKNAATNRVQVIPAPKVFTANTNQGIVAQYSTDVGICASNGLSTLTEVNDATRRVLLMPRTSSGLVINCDPTIIQA